MSAGVTLFVLIALFPALAVLFSLYGQYGDTHALFKGLDMMSDFLPDGGVTILRAELARLGKSDSTLDWNFLVNLAIALWSASGAYTALVAGLNRAYRVREKRSFLRLTWYGVNFALLAIALVTALAMLLPPAFSLMGHSLFYKGLLSVLSWPTTYALSYTAITVIYWYVPDHPRTRPPFFSVGCSVAALCWMMGSVTFTYYVKHFGSYNSTYGQLGPVVGFLTWVWFSVAVLFMGAEIDGGANA
jgi:membrane protein